jgi:hypothetical protein
VVLASSGRVAEHHGGAAGMAAAELVAGEAAVKPVEAAWICAV